MVALTVFHGVNGKVGKNHKYIQLCTFLRMQRTFLDRWKIGPKVLVMFRVLFSWTSASPIPLLLGSLQLLSNYVFSDIIIDSQSSGNTVTSIKACYDTSILSPLIFEWS